MVVSTSKLEDLLTELDDIADIIKGEQEKRRFGGVDNDAFVKYIQLLINQQKTIVSDIRYKLEDEMVSGSPWSLLCGIVPMVYKGGPSKEQIRYIENKLSDAKDDANNVSRLRRQNFSVAALAFHGLFLKSEEDEGIAISWDTSDITGKKYAKVASACTRETLQERADRLYRLSIIVMSLLGYPFWTKERGRVGCEKEGRLKAGEIANLFRLTLELFFAFPKAEILDQVLDVAYDAIVTLSEYTTFSTAIKLARTVSQKEKSLEDKIRSWKSSIEDRSNYLAESQEPADNGVNTTEVDPVLQEMALWHSGLVAADNVGNVRAFSSASLTYSNLSANLPLALNLRVFDQPKNLSSVVTSKGGFATAYMAELEQPLVETVVTFRSDGQEIHTVWNVKKVAAKVVRPIVGAPVKREYSSENATCARIVREMRVWSDMKHENILPLLGVGVDICVKGSQISYPVAISPWMDQGHLHDYLKTHSDTSERERITYMRDVADALVYMHNRKPAIIHGDLKSNNILMREGKVYLCDFGLSRMLDGVSGQTSDVHCNARWAAPELLTFRNGSSTKPSSETDMYSFGSVFLEVLTGDWPYGNDLSDNSVKSNRRKDITTLPDRPVFLAEDSSYWLFMKKCWRIEPLIRPTARQTLAAMEAFLRDMTED